LINVFYGRLSPKDDIKLTMIVEAINKRLKTRFERYHEFFFENSNSCIEFVDVL
jgi:hypothetical protein